MSKWITPWGHLNILALAFDSAMDGEGGSSSDFLQSHFIKAANQFCEIQDLDHDNWSFPMADSDLWVIEDTR